MHNESHELKQAILAILNQHARGRQKALKEAQVLALLASDYHQTTIPKGGGFRNTVDELRDDYENGKLSIDQYILSSNSGYFLPSLPLNEEDFEAYIAELRKRTDTARRRIGAAQKCMLLLSNQPKGQITLF